MEQKNVKMQWAFWYAQKGLSVIPIVPGDKRPLGKWAQYQRERAAPEQIKKWWTDTPDANVGIVTGEISDLAVIDIDSEEGQQNIEQYLPEQFLAPTVTTPRGGKHYYCKHTPGIGNKVGVIPGTDFRGEGGYIVAPPSHNGTGNPYRWQQGFSIADIPLPPLPIAYINKIKINSNKVPCKEATLQTLQTLQFLQKGTRDNDIFHVLNCLAKGGLEKELAYKIGEIIAEKCNPPFPQRDVKDKVESAYGRIERRERNLVQDVRDYISLQDSYIYLTDAYTTLQTLHSSEKANLQVIMHRLCKEGVLEKVGRGTFKKVEQDCADIDIWSADVSPFPIRYPLGLHEFVNTYPKNIIVVAGEPDAGKTAFLLNFARLNMHRHEVVYFSSEMGHIELRTRLEKFNLPNGLEDWKAVTWKERASDFAPMIRPNAVNIIDFLEIHENFFEVGKLIKQIFDKLSNGIAVIALQKPKGRDEGLGGQRGLEKPRLYLSMSPGLLKITKAKNWKHENINPNGMMRKWRLGGGCHFKVEGDWYC